MKDIGNYKLLKVHDALGRLGAAVDRLESAASLAEPALPLARTVPGLKAELDHLSRDHAALKTTAGQVASRLDTAIARLSGVLNPGE